MLVETGGGRDRKILIIHDDLDALNECKKDLDGCEDFQILNADPQAGKDLILNDPDLDALSF
jgi:hypothetical protein